jgi:acetyltransferase-like isoleucine patch superfamily enzyme
MKRLLAALVRTFALRTGRLRWLYLRLCRPNGFEYAEFVRRHGCLHAIGEHCSILPTTTFTDPHLTSLGNNVHFSTCALICHDGSIAMLNRAYDTHLDAVGPIIIRDNVFIGYGAVVLQNVTIGPNSIVAAGAVVTRDVPPDTIVAGVPARPIGTLDDLVARMRDRTVKLPWADLIERRGSGALDPQLEPALIAMRIAHFFDGASHGSASSVREPAADSPQVATPLGPDATSDLIDHAAQ